MRGVFQTLIQRAVSSGLYFPLEDIFRDQLSNHIENLKESRSVHNFLAGTLAGMFNGLFMNPAVSVRVSIDAVNIHKSHFRPILVLLLGKAYR
jgi:hypothetical protein